MIQIKYKPESYVVQFAIENSKYSICPAFLMLCNMSVVIV